MSINALPQDINVLIDHHFLKILFQNLEFLDYVEIWNSIKYILHCGEQMNNDGTNQFLYKLKKLNGIKALEKHL